MEQACNSGNAATLLSEGLVLIACRHDETQVLSGPEIFKRNTGRGTAVGGLSVASDHELIRLADGRVIASGGINGFRRGGHIFADAEFFDPKSGKWPVR